MGHCDWLSGGYASHLFAPRSKVQPNPSPFSLIHHRLWDSLGCFLSRMASISLSPEIAVKKDSISFAPPPAELALPRLSQDVATDDDLYPTPREHPESSHRRASSADSAGGPRRGRAMASPPLLRLILREVDPLGLNNRLIKVSFDTFETRDATTFALTLRSKHRSYCPYVRAVDI